MKLTEERKTDIIGFLLSLVLACQFAQSIAGGKQQASFNRINWLLSHSNKSLTLLSNLSSLVILDEENRLENFENYRKGLADTREQHHRMSIEEDQLLRGINFWGRTEQVSSLSGLILVMVVMYLYSRLILEISKRIK